MFKVEILPSTSVVLRFQSFLRETTMQILLKKAFFSSNSPYVVLMRVITFESDEPVCAGSSEKFFMTGLAAGE